MILAQTLSEILNENKDIRESGEKKLSTAKAASPDMYACYLVSIIQQGINNIPLRAQLSLITALTPNLIPI
jgi:hypothetical protein